MRPSLVLACVLVLAPLGDAFSQDAVTGPAGPTATLKWRLVFGDEFEGTVIDETRWKPADKKEWAHPGFKTRQAKENCALDGQGHLAIRISRDPDGTIAFNHGLQTRDFQKAFGFVEARVRFSTQPGWWGHVCLIRNNTLTNYGDDLFENPQEFDIFEDYFKPKAHPHWPAERHQVISQAFHATVGLGFKDQGDGSGVSAYDTRKKDILSVNKLGRVLRHEYFKPAEYAGWHTVGLHWGPLEQVFYLDGKETLRLSYKDTPITTVPQKLLTGGAFMTPQPLRKDAPHDGKHPPFYGWLEDAQLPDQLTVDYLRWFEEDLDGARVPEVSVGLIHDETYPTSNFAAGRPLKFRIRARDGDGKIASVQLFAKGYLRAEAKIDARRADHVFTVSNLFEGDNTLIATAVDEQGHVGLSSPIRVKITSPTTKK